MEDCFSQLSRRKDGPWLAHRIDADTAGCLIVALRKAPLLEAQAAFAAGRVRKTYWAVVEGGPVASDGVIDAPLGKHSDESGWRMQVRPDGQPAVTEWRVLGRGDALTWLELRPRTGRTHQLRAHCAHAGWPILGDPIYGVPGGLHLLARSIEIPLAPPLAATAPPPPAMHRALSACGWAVSRE